jgi:hypothetical protein
VLVPATHFVLGEEPKPMPWLSHPSSLAQDTRCVPGGFVAGVTTELVMFEEFASGGVKHQKHFWTANKCQCLTEACKTINLCRLHSIAETCKTNWFGKGSNGFGGENVVSDTFVKWLSRGEEHKWSRHTGAVQMEMGFWVGRTGGSSGNGCQGSITTLGDGAQGSIATLEEGALLKSSHWGVAWKRGGTGVGDDSVEAADMGRGLQEGTGNCGRLRVGGNGKITLLEGQALGYAWAGRPVAHADAKI